MYAQPSGGNPDVDITHTPGVQEVFEIFQDDGTRVVKVRILEPDRARQGISPPPDLLDTAPGQVSTSGGARIPVPPFLTSGWTDWAANIVADVDLPHDRYGTGRLSFINTTFDAPTLRAMMGVTADEPGLTLYAFATPRAQARDDGMVEITALVPTNAVVQDDDEHNFFVCLAPQFGRPDGAGRPDA